MQAITLISLAVGIPAAVITVVVGILQIIKLMRQRTEGKSPTGEASTSLTERELELHQRQQEANSDEEQNTSGRNSLLLAEHYLTKGELDKAQNYFRNAIKYYMRVDDKNQLARAKVGLAAALVSDGKPQESIRVAKQVEHLTKDPELQAGALLSMGISYRRTGDYQKSRTALLDSLEIWRDLEEATKAGETLTAIGDVCRKLGRLSAAASHYRECMDTLKGETKRTPPNRDALINYAQAQYALGRILIEQEKYQQAEQVLRKSYGTLERIGAFYGIEMCSQLMGRLHKLNGRFEEARRWFYESFVATAVTKNDLRHVETLFHIAELAFLMDKFARAYALASVSADDAERLRLYSQLARLLVLQGHISYAYLKTDQTNYLPDYTDITEAYQKAILASLRAGSLSKKEIFARIRDRLEDIVESEAKATVGQHIVAGMIEWWPDARIDGKRAELFEEEQDLKSGTPSKRVSEYLSDLRDVVN